MAAYDGERRLHVAVHEHFYSVPYPLVREEVEVRLTATARRRARRRCKQAVFAAVALSLIAHFSYSKSKVLWKLVGQPDTQQCLLQALAEGLTTTAEIYGFATRDETAAWVMRAAISR